MPNPLTNGKTFRMSRPSHKSFPGALFPASSARISVDKLCRQDEDALTAAAAPNCRGDRHDLKLRGREMLCSYLHTHRHRRTSGRLSGYRKHLVCKVVFPVCCFDDSREPALHIITDHCLGRPVFYKQILPNRQFPLPQSLKAQGSLKPYTAA